MANYLDVDPDNLRRLAAQHDRAAADIRKWGEIPQGWLDDLKRKYGTIADTMRGALVDYYDRRHRKAEVQAIRHERTRDKLLVAARALEEADSESGRGVSEAGEFGGVPRAGSGPPGGDNFTPIGPGLGSRRMPGNPSALDSTAAPTPRAGLRALGDHVDDVRRVPREVIASRGDVPPPGVGRDVAPAPGTIAPPAAAGNALSGSQPTPHPGPTEAVAPKNGRAVDAAHGETVTRDRILTVVTQDAPGASSPAIRVPEPLAPGPLAAASRPAEGRSQLPKLEVGGVVDDLTLAHNLLAATLAAVSDSAPYLEWASAVLRTSTGPFLFLTSSEGRGWLPAGLFLPSEVIIPWQWVTGLRSSARNMVDGLEAMVDPARILGEFATNMRRRRVALSALASSSVIDDEVRANLGHNVAYAECVSAAGACVDLSSPGDGLADRLALGGSAHMSQRAAAVPESEIRSTCLELARTADSQVRAVAARVDLTNNQQRSRRQRILEAFNAGRPAAETWVEDLRTADLRSSAVLQTQLRDRTSASANADEGLLDEETARIIVFERRADELLLLAAGDPDHQNLRDAFYAYGQIVEHPALSRSRDAAQTGRRPVGFVDGAGAPRVRVGGVEYTAPVLVPEVSDSQDMSEGSVNNGRV